MPNVFIELFSGSKNGRLHNVRDEVRGHAPPLQRQTDPRLRRPKFALQVRDGEKTKRKSSKVSKNGPGYNLSYFSLNLVCLI